MDGLIIGIILIFFSFVIGGLVAIAIVDKRYVKDCKGFIIMSGDELYLSLTHEDIEAFKHANYVTLKLKREKFQGFNET